VTGSNISSTPSLPRRKRRDNSGGAEHFLVQGGVVLEQSLTLAVPEKTYVQVWSPNHRTTPVTRDGMQVWTWTSSQTKASARDENGKMTVAEVKDPDEDADGRKLQRGVDHIP
jgi:hypothetical protein